MKKKMKKRIIIYDDYNSKFPKEQGIIGTITPQFGNTALRNGWKIIEVYEEAKDKDSE